MHACFEQIGWLEDGLPDDADLERHIDSLGLRNVEIRKVIERFRNALEEPAIRAALSRATYQQPADEKNRSAVHASHDLADPRWEVRQERPFAVPDGHTILRGSIDRLVILYDRNRPVAADVIDFKTDAVGRDDGTALQAAVDTYRPQIDAYRRAVASLLGLEAEQISARLMFVGAGLVVSVGYASA
jgi:ATP-dependent exoDNAse (exonuclease V) beta subunit